VERKQLSDLRDLIAIAQSQTRRAPSEDARRVARIANDTLGCPAPTRVLNERELNEFRTWLRAGLQKMFTEEGWPITAATDYPQFTMHIKANGPNHHEDSAGVSLPRRAAIHLVELQKWRIGRCAWARCGEVFVSHKRSAYCSSTHAQNARTWRYRHGGENPPRGDHGAGQPTVEPSGQALKGRA